MSVRAFRPDEWRTYRDLRLAALADAPDAFARTLAEEQGRSDAEWSKLHAASTTSPMQTSLVAEYDARAVGIAYGRLDDATPDIAHLFAMWVEPAARRSGVGRALVQAVAAWAHSAGARRLTLDVTEGNAPATRLYERTGFARTEVLAPLRAGSSLLVRTLHLDLQPTLPATAGPDRPKRT